MRTSHLVFSLLPVGLTCAAAETTLHNKCSYPVWYSIPSIPLPQIQSIMLTPHNYSTIDSTPPNPENVTTVPPGGYVMQPEWFDGVTGTALKITKTHNGLWENKPVLNWAYTKKDGIIYYDLSSVNGYDWWGETLVLDGETEGAETIVWKNEPGQVPHVASFKGELDLTLTTCA